MATFARPRLRGPELLRAVAEGTAGEVGDAFLRGLVRSVAEALSAKLVLVAEAADPSGIHVRVVAGWYDGAPIEEPFEYDTAGQPCALVPGQTLVSFPEGLVEHFPEDRGAVEMGLESYLAVCLRGSDNTYLGHLAVLDAHRMEAEPEDVAVLKIFASRAGAELERRIQARALQASRARVIEAADAERRRVGRDLHDGAQQRLLAVSNLLRVARRKPETADKLLETAEQELSAAHAELRELARGLHPVALAERGLPAAIESLSSGSALCVTLNVCPDELPGRDRRGRLLRGRRVPDQRVALRPGLRRHDHRLARGRPPAHGGGRRRGRRRRPRQGHRAARARRPPRGARRRARGAQPAGRGDADPRPRPPRRLSATPAGRARPAP